MCRTNRWFHRLAKLLLWMTIFSRRIFHNWIPAEIFFFLNCRVHIMQCSHFPWQSFKRTNNEIHLWFLFVHGESRCMGNAYIGTPFRLHEHYMKESFDLARNLNVILFSIQQIYDVDTRIQRKHTVEGILFVWYYVSIDLFPFSPFDAFLLIKAGFFHLFERICNCHFQWPNEHQKKRRKKHAQESSPTTAAAKKEPLFSFCALCVQWDNLF